MRSGQSRQKAGCKHKGFIYGQALSEGESFTSLELKINFLKPVWKARLRAEGSVVNEAKTIGLVTCDIFDEKKRLIARASCTCMTLKGKQAEGR
ncbi:MAG: PaaI family thioesterase [Syntrophobacteraceae bacterium]|nr:PaaI family thioesterase [Syntrophobacteraceae bacterium]